MTTADILVRGQVQGVSLRALIREYALQAGLGGYAENTPDGAVHIVCQGEQSAIEKFAAWLQEHPGRSHIDAVSVSPAPTAKRFTTFTIQYS